MAFSDFKYPDVVRQLGLTWRTHPDLFAAVPPVPSGPPFRDTLAVVSPLAATVNTEKARSEWMTALVLGDLWSRYGGQVSLFSGNDFQGDPAAGLNGFCDFLISRSPQQPEILAPVVVIFEGKRENINDGLGQCIAGMVGAQRFNRRHNNPVDPVYGCVTIGSQWKFLTLSGTTVTFDLIEYQLHQVDKLLGILTHMVGPVPQPAAA
ncbi:MAG: hypothetical protein K2X87_19665 [Gemmataceae bacterium]|nr:hypothetical protein [Gemmataceae bacterium]